MNSKNPEHKIKRSGLVRLIHATHHSVEGLIEAFKTEEAVRLELICIIILLPVVFLLNATAAERAILVFSLLWILIVELVNTALETIVDRVSDEYHLLSKRAKDIASAVVFLSILSTVAIWAIIVGPKIL